MATKSEKNPKTTEKLRKTEFSLSAPQTQSVSIAGGFNQWNPSSHPLKMDDKGIWRISLALNPGQYEYRFFVNGEWENGPNCSSFFQNPFGTSNSWRIVK